MHMRTAGVIAIDGSVVNQCSMYLCMVGFSSVAGSVNSAKALSDMLGDGRSVL